MYQQNASQTHPEKTPRRGLLLRGPRLKSKTGYREHKTKLACRLALLCKSKYQITTVIGLKGKKKKKMPWFGHLIPSPPCHDSGNRDTLYCSCLLSLPSDSQTCSNLPSSSSRTRCSTVISTPVVAGGGGAVQPREIGSAGKVLMA